MSVIFVRAFSDIPADRIDKLRKGELAMVTDGIVCSLVLRVEDNVYEFKSKKIGSVVTASPISGSQVSITRDDSPYTVPTNHTHLTINCDCTSGSVVINLPSVINLEYTSLDIKRTSNSILQRLMVNASETRLSSGDRQRIDGSTSIKIGRKNLSVSLKSKDTGWSIV